MDQKRYEGARSRTDSKLRYAGVHLEELQSVRRGGDDFDRAHQESFLFHLIGVRDAFLQELNIYHECNLALDRVHIESLTKALKGSGKRSQAIETLTRLEADSSSWFSRAKEMRDHSTHRHSVPRVYHIGGERHGQVFLTNTSNGAPVETDFILLFERWKNEMASLISEMRKLN